MNYQTYFLDADDTLFDFQKSSIKAFEKTFLELDSQLDWQLLFATFKNVSHQLWLDFEKGLIDRLSLRYERFTQTFTQHGLGLDSVTAGQLYLENLCSNIYFIDGAIEVLENLKGQKKKIGILTNGISYVQQKRLENSVLGDFIDFMVVSEECEHPKPHTSMFERAFELSQAHDKKDVLMLGDSLTSDIQGSINFGIHSCWYNPNKLISESVRPTYEIHNISDFHQYI